MDNISICVSFIAAILGIAYPILLEVISRLDEKYSSLVIIDLFQKEKENTFFIITLKLSLLFLLLWILELQPIVHINSLNQIIGNSAQYLLIISTSILIIVFFFFIKKVFIYYTPTRFLLYLVKKHKYKVEKKDFHYFGAIADLLFYSIRNHNEKLAFPISDFMFDAFKSVRDKSKNIEVIYPDIYYEVVSKTIEVLATQRNRRFTFLEHLTAGSTWLLGEFEDSKISDETYSCIWSNLVLSLKYERDDYIIYHWEHSHQYLTYSLKRIEPSYSQQGFEIENQQEIDLRKSEKEKFLELHYALGGLLLFKGRYQCVNRAFTYTQSIPPHYELLPYNMDEIFRLYFRFIDPIESRFPLISQRYYFPEISGANSDGIIKRWICKYIGVLFIRQYSIVQYLMYLDPLSLPSTPPTQIEKRRWIDSIDFFKTIVNEVLNDKELLSNVRLDFITDDWCVENNHDNPLDFIEKVKQKVIDSYEGTQVAQEISPIKRKNYIDISESKLNQIFKEYEVINNDSELSGETNNWYINGVSNIFNKSSFADNQDSDDITTNSYLADQFVDKYRKSISEIFYRATSQSYLFDSGDIVHALRNLEINHRDYLIISFGINLEELLSKEKHNHLKGITIINFAHRNYPLIGDSIFIIRKIDLPKFNFLEIEDEILKKYLLKKSKSEYNFYLTIVDLNIEENLRNALMEYPGKKEFTKSVFLGIFIKLEVQLKKDVECIQIRQNSAFFRPGILNLITDVKPINTKSD